MVNQLWVMIEGRGDLLSGRWSCHYLMNNEPLPAIHTETRAHKHFTFSLHPSISSFWLSFHGQMAFTVPPCAKRQEYFCLSTPTTYSVKVQLPELWNSICNMMNWHHNIIQNNKKAKQELANIGLCEHHLGVQPYTEKTTSTSMHNQKQN